jgi:hypothetical protein
VHPRGAAGRSASSSHVHWILHAAPTPLRGGLQRLQAITTPARPGVPPDHRPKQSTTFSDPEGSPTRRAEKVLMASRNATHLPSGLECTIVSSCNTLDEVTMTTSTGSARGSVEWTLRDHP